MIKRLIDWFKMLMHRRRMKKQLDKLRKHDPFIY